MMARYLFILLKERLFDSQLFINVFQFSPHLGFKSFLESNSMEQTDTNMIVIQVLKYLGVGLSFWARRQLGSDLCLVTK